MRHLGMVHDKVLAHDISLFTISIFNLPSIYFQNMYIFLKTVKIFSIFLVPGGGLLAGGDAGDAEEAAQCDHHHKPDHHHHHQRDHHYQECDHQHQEEGRGRGGEKMCQN